MPLSCHGRPWRHRTKGQRAMAVAMIYPKPEKGGRGKKSKLNLEFSGEYVRPGRALRIKSWAASCEVSS
jgi:hypothetical protein